ncbi:hypothetical protein GGR51DRAFT_540473 [Nemania sp. FL0031]|nr:hypothetical protein GGR51DRAFT_540473 [Nemania sp. FL0031]
MVSLGLSPFFTCKFCMLIQATHPQPARDFPRPVPSSRLRGAFTACVRWNVDLTWFLNSCSSHVRTYLSTSACYSTTPCM